MKKYFSLFALQLLLLLNVLISNAQTNFLPDSYATRKRTQSANTWHRIFLNDINIKAKRDLKHKYKDVDNERWDESSEGVITAQFNLNGCTTMVYYDKYGRWTATLKNYQETGLPFAIRDRVKSVYYDFSIEFVDELMTARSNKIPTYIVHIRYKNQIKLIRVSNGEMDVWKEFNMF